MQEIKLLWPQHSDVSFPTQDIMTYHLWQQYTNNEPNPTKSSPMSIDKSVSTILYKDVQIFPN